MAGAQLWLGTRRWGLGAASDPGSGGMLGGGLGEREDGQGGGNPQGLGGRDRVEEVWAARGRGPPGDGGQVAPRRLLSGGASLCTFLTCKMDRLLPPRWSLPGLTEAASPQLQTAGHGSSWPPGCPELLALSALAPGSPSLLGRLSVSLRLHPWRSRHCCAAWRRQPLHGGCPRSLGSE